MKQLESRIKELPQDLQEEVLDYIEFLLSKKAGIARKKPESPA